MLRGIARIVLTVLAEGPQSVEAITSLCGLAPYATLETLSAEGLINNIIDRSLTLRPLYCLTALGRLRLRLERAETANVLC